MADAPKNLDEAAATRPGEADDLEALARELALTDEGLALLGAASENANAEPAPASDAKLSTATSQGHAGKETGLSEGNNVKKRHASKLLRPRVLALLTAAGMGVGAVILTRRPEAADPAADAAVQAAKKSPQAVAKISAAAAQEAGSPSLGLPQTAALRTSGQVKAWVWPAPTLVPLTAARVQQLDCPSLRAGLQREDVAPGLAAWARFRLAWACGDTAARTQALPPQPAVRRHVSSDDMLANAGRAGLARLQEGELPATRLRPGSWLRTPQGRLIAALFAKNGTSAERRAAISKLQQARSLGSDGQILLASLHQASEPAQAERILQSLVAEGDALALARASRALFEMAAWPSLLFGLDARADELTARALPKLLVQASRLHRGWLVAMALRYQLAVGNLADAFELARLQQQLRPSDAAQQQVKALATLVGVEQAELAAPNAGGVPNLDGSDLNPSLKEGESGPQAPASWATSLPASTAALQQALQTAQKQQDSTAEASLAAALLWHDPLAQDPVPLALMALAGPLRAANDANARAPFVGFLQRWAQARPQDDRPLLQLTAAAQACHDTALQIAALQSLLLRHPQDEALSLRLAGALLDAGDTARAQPLLTALGATISAAGKPDLLYVQARAVAAHDPLQARMFLAAANKLRPDARNDLFLSELLEAHGQVEEAAAALGRASAARPEDVALAVRQADLLLRAGNGAQARTLMQRWVAARPTDLAARYKLYEIDHKLGNLADAAESLRAAATLPGASAELWVQLGRLQLLEMGQLEQGIATLRQALVKVPQAAEAHYLLGLGLRDLGDERGMRQSWQRYLALAPKGAFAAEVHQGLRR